MFRVYAIRGAERRLIAGTTDLRTAQDCVTRSANHPLDSAASFGRPRRANEFLSREVNGIRYEIIEVPTHPLRRASAA